MVNISTRRGELWMCHVTHVNESSLTYGWVRAASLLCRWGWVIALIEGVMSHMWMSRGRHMQESWLTHASRRAHCNTHTATHILQHTHCNTHCNCRGHMQESWRTHACVASHIWMRRVTFMNASCHTYECVVTHVWRHHATHSSESWRTHEGVVPHIWIRRVTHTKESWLAYELSHMKTSRHTYQWDVATMWKSYGVATISRLLQILGLFCKRAL